MNKSSYTLRYLPLFYNDLEDKITYIMDKLQNKKAAHDLLNAIERAILERVEYAESYEVYHSLKERRYPYYRIYVGNYVIYYVVIKDENDKKIMEVRRILYKGQDRDGVI